MIDGPDREPRKAIPADVGLIFGAAVGVVLSVVTDNAASIGIGAGLGILAGAGFAGRS